jgi:hypothetical protein
MCVAQEAWKKLRLSTPLETDDVSSKFRTLRGRACSAVFLVLEKRPPCLLQIVRCSCRLLEDRQGR